MVRGRKPTPIPEAKVCKHCKKEKPIEEFPMRTLTTKLHKVDGTTKFYTYDRFTDYCKECLHESNVRYRRPGTIIEKLDQLIALVGEDPKLMKARELVVEFKGDSYKRLNT